MTAVRRTAKYLAISWQVLPVLALTFASVALLCGRALEVRLRRVLPGGGRRS